NIFRCYQGSEWRDCISSVTSTWVSGNYSSTTGNSGSLTYSDMPGASLAFTKKAASTKVVAALNMPIRTVIANPGVIIGAKIDSGSVTGCVNFIIPSAGAGNTQDVSCTVVITGISAGSHTLKVDYASVGANNITTNTQDQFSILIQETD